MSYETIEVEVLEKIAVIGRRLDQSFELIARVALEKLRCDRSAVDADAQRAVVVARDRG